MAMKFPCLVDKRFCKADTVVTIEQEGVDKYGEPLDSFTYNGKCNYQDTARVIYTADKKEIQLTGYAYFPGDIAPMIPVISGGTIVINGAKRNIYNGTKARNPDNTVNHTKIRVM